MNTLKRIVFLEIDGVLTSSGPHNLLEQGFDHNRTSLRNLNPIIVDRLINLLCTARAEPVILPYRGIQSLENEVDFDRKLKRLSYDFAFYGIKIFDKLEQDDLIADWLLEHEDIAKFVVLVPKTTQISDILLKDNMIKTNPERGLTRRNTKKAIKLFNH